MSDTPSNSDSDSSLDSGNSTNGNGITDTTATGDEVATDGGSHAGSVSADANTASQQPAGTIEPTNDVGTDLEAATQRVFAEDTQFADWAYTREQQRNIDDGYGPTRNDPASVPDAKTFSPSQLLSCPRQQYYSDQNAPEEKSLPHGLFLFGHEFEDLYQSFLEDVVGPNIFVDNTVHINFVEAGVRFSGSTDPVITDRTGAPLVLTEIKTTKNLHYVRRDGVKRRHKAQAHAYARGLQNEHGLSEPPEIRVVYAGRETLDIEEFTLEFDQEFWNEVVEWAQETASYRIEDVFPPTVDEDQEFMCDYCEFSERCGNYEPGPKPGSMGGDWDETPDDYWWDNSIATGMMDQLEDQPVVGFIPLKRYPETQAIEHLQAHPDVTLTPTIAAAYPDLVADGTQPAERLLNTYGVAPQRKVHDWVCSLCGGEFGFGRFDWDGDIEDPPQCPTCSDDSDEDNAPLRGPTPEDQAEKRREE